MAQTQTALFPELSSKMPMPKPVNVASVPHRSPFRYPGGKTWFVPTFRQWLSQMNTAPNVLIEPFAGGGIVSLTALFENLVKMVVMVERDEEIAAVWQAIVAGDAKWLAERILKFELSKEAVVNEIRRAPKSIREKAFQTILKNRTFHGGILADGAGFLKNGENGKGIHSRWYPATLAKRFLNLDQIANNIDFRCDDAFNVIREYADRNDVVFFIDPPYTAGGKKAGKRLYTYYDIDHETLFALCKNLKGDFLITYDDAEEVKNLSRKYNFDMRLIPMTNTHHATMEELVIGRNLSWMNIFPSVHEPTTAYKIRHNRKKTQT